MSRHLRIIEFAISTLRRNVSKTIVVVVVYSMLVCLFASLLLYLANPLNLDVHLLQKVLHHEPASATGPDQPEDYFFIGRMRCRRLGNGRQRCAGSQRSGGFKRLADETPTRDLQHGSSPGCYGRNCPPP